ncbi:6568_t:CDS:2 [Paraglomus brasilianum]|uniref:6568_t:CDS:1 n=1 Tax=Paraglomus brasilianum TaxID=144538 RepID=A0A9N9GT15_9GLOM|nr:6568_t:CDS:2 [Paraglomus brasilianum]
MSNIEDNHFVLNCNENEAKLYFKYWLEYVYLAKISSFTGTNVTAKTATAAYLTELSAAMDECAGNKRHSAKLTHVQKKFGTIKKVLVYGTKNAGSVDIKGLVVRFHRHALGILRCFCIKLLRAMPRVPHR